MTVHAHAIVWIDHQRAKVIFFNAREDTEITIRSDPPPSHIHTRVGSPSGTHLHGDPAFFGEVADIVAPTEALLLVGPSSAKDQFDNYLREHRPAIAARLAGTEPLDKESNGQLLAFARAYFRRRDRMTPQK